MTREAELFGQPNHEDHRCQYRQVLENIREVTWIFSSNFQRTEYVSLAYEKIWERSRESLYVAPLSWIDAIHPDDRQAVVHFIENCRKDIDAGAAFPAFRIVCSSGKIRWIRARLFTLEMDGPCGCLLAIVAQDVSRSRFFESALRESEEKWRSLTENSPDHVLLTDLDGYILFANRDFLGQAKGHLVGKHLLRAIPQPYGNTIQSRLEQAVQNEFPDSCFIESVIAGSRKAHFELRLSPLTVGGETVGVAVNSTEITTRVEQERALLESEAFHRTLFEESPTGIILQDFSAIEAPVQRLTAAGVQDLRAHLRAHPEEVEQLAGQVRIVRVNQAAVDLYNAPSARHMTGPLVTFFNDQDRDHFIDQLVVFSNGADRYEGEARNRDYDGRLLHLIVRKVVINREENGLSKVLTTLTDITSMREAEKERRELLLQLQQAQKMEAIGTLAGGVAHDFNNILGIILGNAELAMMDSSPDNPAHGNIQEIRRASLRAKEIVSQLLGFSRKTERILKPIHLTPLVQEAANFMRATIPANIVIDSDFAAARDVIQADATQIHQVLINLMTNAGHAMEEDGGRLSIRMDNVDPLRERSEAILPVTPGHYVRITVGDTGTGIPEEVQERIFEPYFTTKKLGKGTGMGLAVVHGILKSYAGGLVLETHPGEGTRFEIYLPLTGEPAKGSGSQIPDAPSGNERILFVDDESMIVDFAESCLTRLGYQVKCCTDPVEALNLVAAGEYPLDLLISDMTMPGMTGVQLAQKLHALNPSVPIILCTGDRNRIPKDKLTGLRVAAVLDKPVELNTLAAAVRKVFDPRDS